jgi:rhodanese-related sulfurtransferase
MVEEDGSAVSRLLEKSRVTLDRVLPGDLASVQAAGALVVDIRPVEQRERDGDLPGAVVIDRNVLEWRLDPTSPHRLPMADDPRRRIVLVCHEGYSSSLAAHTLQRLGLTHATDLCGGYHAWSSVASVGLMSVDGAKMAPWHRTSAWWLWASASSRGRTASSRSSG